ncbi:MAG TPA: ATP-binding protein [Devosiaceae bacterium]|nr:ATP-binding protein [Devosiaceae bacterium]
MSNGRRDLVTAICTFVAAPFQRLATELSPVTIAVGATALLAAALSVVVDAALMQQDTASRDWPAAGMASAQPVAEWTSEDLTGLAAAPAASATTNLWTRGGVAFGGAFLITALAFRRRRPRSQARHDRDTFAQLLDSLPFGVACWTGTGKLLACNEEYRVRLTAAGEELQPGCAYREAIRHLFTGGDVATLSETEGRRLMELHRPDGTCLLIEERPLPDGGFLTIVTDITVQRETDHLLSAVREEQRLLARRYHEEKLRAEAASRSKTAFLAHLSHDIRTPLNHIIGFAEMMRHQTYGPLGDTRYLDYVQAMQDSGQRLLDFFATILELAELESGRKVLVMEPLMVDDLLRQVRRRYAAQAKGAGVVLALGASCGAELQGDRFSLERMLGNLLENAIRFTPTGGQVTLAAFAAADGVVLEVTDTGIGMSEERLASLSQPFAFGDASFTREHKGAGLGIAIARTIAELSGGRLAIDSREALGTTVAISLPMRSVEQQIAA